MKKETMEKEVLDYYSNTCPECDSKTLISDESRGEIICNKCGLVLNLRIIDSGREWRSYSSEESNRKARTGPLMPQFVMDKGTMIDFQNIDAHGKFIDAKMVNLINRLRKWNRRTKISKSRDRNLAFAMEELDRVSSQLHLSQKVKEDTAFIYKKVIKKNITKGRSIVAMLLACIYISCKKNETPKLFEQISEISSIDKKRIVDCYKIIFKSLNLKNIITGPGFFVSEICSALNLSSNTETIARNILKKIENALICIGKHPKAVAGAAIYAAGLECGEKRTQKEISIASGVCETTIRNQFNEIKNKINSFL